MVKIAINIRVIKLHAGENHVFWPVVKKLRSLVEKRSIVFIPLKDNVDRRCRAASRYRN